MKTKISTFVLFLIGLLSFTQVYADNPHFVIGPTITDNGTTLTATGSIAGLGNNALVTITLSANTVVTSICQNPGGNIAPGQTKTETVTASGTFRSDKNGRVNNGRVNFTLTTQTPAPGDCPSGKWTGSVSNVEFSDVKILVNGQEID
jgi:hypothetical protein